MAGYEDLGTIFVFPPATSIFLHLSLTTPEKEGGMSAEVGVLLASLRLRVVDMLLTRQRCAGGERLDCARGTKNKRCG